MHKQRFRRHNCYRDRLKNLQLCERLHVCLLFRRRRLSYSVYFPKFQLNQFNFAEYCFERERAPAARMHKIRINLREKRGEFIS